MANSMGAIAAGLSAGINTFQNIQSNNQRMEEAKLAKKKAQAAFDEEQAMAPMRKEGAELELQQLKNQVGAQNQTAVQQMAIDGISRFRSDGDTKHLNTWMERAKKNPLGKKLHGDVARFDKITQTPANDKLLKQAGIPNVENYYANPEEFPSLVLVTRTDGTQAIGDMNLIQAQVGYDKYMNNADLEKRERESIVTARLREGKSTQTSDKMDKVIASLQESNPDMTYAEAYEQVKNMGKTQSGSNDQTGIKAILEENPGMSYLDASIQWFDTKKGDTGKSDRDKYIAAYLEENPGATTMEANEKYDDRISTSTQKEIKDVDAVKDQLDELGFFDMDMSAATQKQKADVHRYISKIEDLRDIKLSNEDKRLMRDFSSLTKLAGDVGENLSEEQTGLVDNLFSGLKGYLFNDVGGKPAKSAYQTFTNIMLKTMSGAAVSDQEMTRMVKAAGSANLQLKPLLSAFRVQVQTIKSQLESIRDTNDPYLAQYYLGKDLGEIDDVIRGLDTRLGDIRSAGLNATSGVQYKEQTAADLNTQLAPASDAPKVKVNFDNIWKEVSQ